ncbi:PorP/SprF family type IX secretion system membrane protein [Aquirufa sp. ROCK2-A2]
MKKVFSFFLVLLISQNQQTVFGQDPQLSQFYAAPLLISPAFAGINGISKINFNHRNQWPNLSANYQFSAISADISLNKYNMGLGFLVTNDVQFANLRTTNIGMQYAYHLNVSEDQSISFGLQGSFVTRGLSNANLIFGDQLNTYLSTGSIASTIDPVNNILLPNIGYLDLTAGALINRGNSWVGLSVAHLNTPNKSLVQGSEDRLSMNFSLQVGTKIMLEDSYYEMNTNGSRNNEKSISPVLHFKKQGMFNQLDLGAYLTIAPLVIGTWYRGVPIQKSADGTSGNRESLVALLGYRKDNFSIGYSYDVTISKLGMPSGGSHELSMAYLFNFGQSSIQKTYQKFKRNLSCPKF